jgi:AAA15 family ATPase/GTPase
MLMMTTTTTTRPPPLQARINPPNAADWKAGRTITFLSVGTDMPSFQPGSILRVSLKNFVTYTAAEFYPGPNMNLVIGPNGSGKSTIVCAICLGLGYSPNVLGRATALGDYVQHGKETAEIEIELAEKDNKSIVIKRKLKKDKNQSTYYVNGTAVPGARPDNRETRYASQSTRDNDPIQYPNR